MAGIQAWLGEGILACCKYVGLYSCDEQQKPISCRLSLPDGLIRIGIVNEEPPYAEPHVRWCERSENEVGRKLLRFPPTRSISTPIKNMGYPCHFSISNPCRLMEDGGCPPKDRVRMAQINEKVHLSVHL